MSENTSRGVKGVLDDPRRRGSDLTERVDMSHHIMTPLLFFHSSNLKLFFV